jgi:hypothetical protein
MTDPGSGTPMSERMQALLSRAVEDQLSEQRQVAGAMTEVRNHLAHLGAELQQLRATAGGAADEEIQRQVAGVAADVREAIRVLSERLDGVTVLVHERLDGMTALVHERLDGVTALVQQRGNDLADIRGALDNELRPRVDGVDAAMRDLRGAFTGIGSRVADLPGRQDIEAMIARTGEAVAPVEERLEQLQGWVEEVHEGLFGETGVHPRVQALVEQAAEGSEPSTSGEEIAGQIDQAVRAAVAASEKRVTAHVDEAVLALAEALLRRRNHTGGLGLSAFDTGPIPVIPPAPHDYLDGPEPAAEFAPEPAAEAAPEPAAVTEPLSEPEATLPSERHAPLSSPASPDAGLPPASSPTLPPAPSATLPPALSTSLPPPPEPPAAPAQIDLDPAPAPSPGAYQPAAVSGAAVDGHDDLDDDEARRRRPWWRPGD